MEPTFFAQRVLQWRPNTHIRAETAQNEICYLVGGGLVEPTFFAQRVFQLPPNAHIRAERAQNEAKREKRKSNGSPRLSQSGSLNCTQTHISGRKRSRTKQNATNDFWQGVSCRLFFAVSEKNLELGLLPSFVGSLQGLRKLLCHFFLPAAGSPVSAVCWCCCMLLLLLLANQ